MKKKKMENSDEEKMENIDPEEEEKMENSDQNKADGKIKLSIGSSSEDMCRLRQTGSGRAADSKLRYTIQFSILMLCAKYQEAGFCGS